MLPFKLYIYIILTEVMLISSDKIHPSGIKPTKTRVFPNELSIMDTHNDDFLSKIQYFFHAFKRDLNNSSYLTITMISVFLIFFVLVVYSLYSEYKENINEDVEISNKKLKGRVPKEVNTKMYTSLFSNENNTLPSKKPSNSSLIIFKNTSEVLSQTKEEKMLNEDLENTSFIQKKNDEEAKIEKVEVIAFDLFSGDKAEKLEKEEKTAILKNDIFDDKEKSISSMITQDNTTIGENKELENSQLSQNELIRERLHKSKLLGQTIISRCMKSKL